MSSSEVNQQLHDAIVHHQQGDLPQAESAYLKILQTDPRNADAHHLLGTLRRISGRRLEALASISQAIALNPLQPSFYNNLGNCYLDTSEWVVAELCYRYALQLQPDEPNVLTNLGLALQRQNRHDESTAVLKRALELDPNNALALTNLGQVSVDTDLLQDALSYYQRALALQPTLLEASLGVAKSLVSLDRHEDALVFLDGIEFADPEGIPELMLIKGTALQALGRIDKAASAYERGLEKSPGNAALTIACIQLGRVKSDDQSYRLITGYEPHLDKLTGLQLAESCYALGKAYQDVGHFDRAAKSYERGAAARRAMSDYDEKPEQKFVAFTRGNITRTRLEQLVTATTQSDVPIFIVGMPRSGTTLTEQILASHQGVAAGGELEYWLQALHRYRIPSTEFDFSHPTAPDLPTDAGLTERAAWYLEKVSQIARASGKQHVTDKLPANYLTLGLIAVAFPNAKIVHCRRDPIDNAISIYTTNFNGISWSFDLGMIGRQTRRYWELMNHWRTELPGRFLEVRYEQMVENQEEESRRLLEWCGLDWDDAVLQFHKTQRSVMTASVSQVRQPIYNSSVGRWKKWKPYIQPLLDEIGDLEIAYWDEIDVKVEL